MSGTNSYCKVEKNYSSGTGKWIIIIIILSLMHVLSFMWMIHMQIKFTSIESKLKDLFDDEDAAMDDHNASDADSRINEGLYRRPRGLQKGCLRFRRKLEKCKPIEKKYPVYAASTQVESRHIIQLVGNKKYGVAKRHKRNGIVTDWVQELSKGNGLEYVSGFIEIKEAGFYFIYAQMIPNHFADEGLVKGETKEIISNESQWEFSIHLRQGSNKKGKELASAKLSIPQCKDCNKSSMVVTRTVQLNIGDRVGIKVIDGSTWWSSEAAQVFGAYAL